MSITETANISVSTAGGGAAVTGKFEETGVLEESIDKNFASSSTNVLYTIAIDVSQIQLITLVSTQNMTIKTNSSGSPANTINLVANAPLIWSASAGYFSNPLTTDVTAFYVTCTASARLRGKILTN